MTDAPKITPEAMENEIVYEATFTAANSLAGLSVMGQQAEGSYADIIGTQADTGGRLSLLTVHIVVLRNGFTVVGTSSPVSMENFNAEIGRDVARKKALDQLWPVLGYALLDRMHEAAAIAQDSALQSEAGA